MKRDKRCFIFILVLTTLCYGGIGFFIAHHNEWGTAVCTAIGVVCALVGAVYFVIAVAVDDPRM